MAHPFSNEIPELLQKHFDSLTSSAISIDVIRERGYKSVLGKTPLIEAGFSKSQQRAPGILIPLHGVDNSIVGHQYRPDRPRTGAKERVIKYENPTGSAIRLDVPPRCYGQLGNPNIPLWFTEGVKKVDSLASQGACAIGLTGVWGFKGKNILGGTTILADFDYISLKGRIAYLVFDSDSNSNPQVQSALKRLASHLERKGASVRILQLPPSPNGEKIGTDDYLSQGHNLEDLKLLGVAEPEKDKRLSKEMAADTYCIDAGRICWIKQNQDGTTEVPLCNFTAKVIEDILRDNGIETARVFRISGQLGSGQPLPVIEVSTSSFSSLGWVTGEWGVQTVIAAGQSHKDRLREAIQLLSQEAKQRIVYTHTGWREINGEITFLSGSGAMGNANVEVELDAPLKRYQLLEPSGDPSDAIKESLDFLLVADLKVTMPLLTSMYLAPLSEILDPSFTLWLVGPTGAFKSTITALALSHFGTFDMRHLPASWRDTPNQLEKLLFLAKDMPMVIDDWAPGQDSAKSRELESKAEYIVRAQGNRQGRGRMRVDTTSRPNYIPRGLLITSGEQLPSGHSHTARIYSVEIEPSDVNIGYLTKAQEQQYKYCVSMSHYILWLKNCFAELKKSLPQKWQEYRDKAQGGDKHPRLPEVIANLYVATEMMTKFAQEHGAITQKETKAYLTTAWEIFYKLAIDQAVRVEEERPGKRFIEVLRAMLDQGRAVLWSKDDDMPRQPTPGIYPVGWIENTDLESFILLNPKPVYGAVHEYCQRSGDPFTFKENAVWKDLQRLGYLLSNNGRTTTTAKIYGATRRVLKINRAKIDVL